MNIAYVCVLCAALMPLLLAGLAKYGGVRQGVDYDNSAPRLSLARLAGWAQRANWAQQNCWEAFPVFAAAVLMAQQAGVEQGALGVWCGLFLAARLAYVACYLLDLSSLRSLCWVVGFGVSMRLMVAAL